MSIVYILLTPSPAATDAAADAADGGWGEYGGEIITGIVAIFVFTISQLIDWRIRVGDRNIYKNNAVLDKALEDHWSHISDYRELATKAESFASMLPQAYNVKINSDMCFYIWYDQYGRHHDMSEEIEEENERLTEEVANTRKELEDLIKVYAGESEQATSQLEALKTAIAETMDRYWAGIREADTGNFDASAIDKAVALLRSRITEMKSQAPVK